MIKTFSAAVAISAAYGINLTSSQEEFQLEADIRPQENVPLPLPEEEIRPQENVPVPTQS